MEVVGSEVYFVVQACGFSLVASSDLGRIVGLRMRYLCSSLDSAVGNSFSIAPGLPMLVVSGFRMVGKVNLVFGLVSLEGMLPFLKKSS